jgi:hypothetical protein
MRQLHRQQGDEDRPRSRKRLSYANVASTMALVIAVGGGTAWAASHHYLINSTKQIRPSVLRKLHGANGSNGTNGTNGTNGATGPTGPSGAVAGIVASKSAAVDFSAGTLGHPTTILTLSLPAGSFLVNAKTVVTATKSTAPNTTDYVSDTCQLFDGSTTDTAWFDTAFTGENLLGSYFGRTTLAAEIAVSSTTASTTTLACDELSSNGTGIGSTAAYTQIQAVHTTVNTSG